MNSFWQRILSEPTLIMEVVRQGIVWAIGMGYWAMTGDQQTLTISLVSAVLAVINRAVVRPITGN